MAASNNFASGLLLALCVLGDGAGSGSLVSGHGGRSGGGRYAADFVPAPRRLVDAGSDVFGRIWALYRSFVGSGFVPEQGGWKRGGRSGAVVPDLGAEALWPRVVHRFRLRRSTADGSCGYLQVLWGCFSSLVLRRPGFLCFSSVADGGGWRRVSRWFSVRAVALVSLSGQCMPAFVLCIAPERKGKPTPIQCQLLLCCFPLLDSRTLKKAAARGPKRRESFSRSASAPSAFSGERERGDGESIVGLVSWEMVGRRRRGGGMLDAASLPLLLLLGSCSFLWPQQQILVAADTDASDVTALNTLFTSLNSPGQLKGWQANGGDPCGQSWQGITCSGSSVTAIKLPSLGLSGNLGYNMNTMGSLVEIDMSQNNLGGGQAIQYNLPTDKLERLNLAGNQFAGNLPYSIFSMNNLKYLNLNHNQLQGKMTDVFSNLGSLTTMDLSFNSLTGDLPQGLTGLSSLKTLYLQNNQFTGDINFLANLPLSDLNIANNRFTGWIPSQLKKINSLQTDGNSWTTGPAPPPPPFTAPPSNSRKSPGQNDNGSSGSGGKSGIGGGGVAGIIISLLVVGAIVAFLLIRRRKRKPKMQEHFEQHQPFTSFPSNEVKDMKPFEESTTIDVDSLASASSIGLKPPTKIERNNSFEDDDFSNKRVPKKSNTKQIKAIVYSVSDLQIATDSFSMDNLVGEGTFGRVYRSQFDDGKVLAVKKLDCTVIPFQSSDDFVELVSNISKLHHPNLNDLVGYCMEHGQHLLVYDFHRNGSLHDLLHLSDEYSKPLSWNSRIKIALGSARALEYLHEVCSPSIVHKNFKSSNILLDSEFNPHVSDAGLASFMPDAEFQAVEQSAGCTAPEVDMTGQYTLKSDVYSFGVVMLELLTGRRPFDSSKPRSEQSLVRWATPQLHDIDALDSMVDPALKGLYPAKSLSRFADVLALCVQAEPEFRPPMSEVVEALVRLVQRANMTKKMLDGDSSRRGDDQDQDFI